jgi:hypothetical protein
MPKRDRIPEHTDFARGLHTNSAADIRKAVDLLSGAFVFESFGGFAKWSEIREQLEAIAKEADAIAAAHCAVKDGTVARSIAKSLKK